MEDATLLGTHVDLHLMVVRPLPQQTPELFVLKWKSNDWTDEEREACRQSKTALDNAARLFGLEFEVSR